MPSRRSRRKKRSTTASPPPQPPPIPIETGNEPSGAPDSTVGAVLGPSKSREAPKTPHVTRRSARVQLLVNTSAQEDPHDDGEPPAAAAVAAVTPGEHIAAPCLLGMASTYLSFRFDIPIFRQPGATPRTTRTRLPHHPHQLGQLVSCSQFDIARFSRYRLILPLFFSLPGRAAQNTHEVPEPGPYFLGEGIRLRWGAPLLPI